MGSRYVTKREGYGFTAGLIIQGSPTHAHQIPLEFYKTTPDAPSYTLRAFDKDFEFSETTEDAWNPVYESIIEHIKANFLTPIAGKTTTDLGPMN